MRTKKNRLHLHDPNSPARKGGVSFLTIACVAASLLWLALSPLPAPAANPKPKPEKKTAATKPDSQTIELSPLVRKLLADKDATAAERRKLALFHGQWDSVTQPTVAEQAQIALQKYDLSHPSLRDPAAPPLLRARAALERGEPATALELLSNETTAQAALIKAEALQQLGRVSDATAQLTPWRDKLQTEALTDAAELTAAAEGMAMLARLEGRPARDYQLAMSLLGKARDELDRLYWPAHLAEARLLHEKDNSREAAEALMAALQLNPRAGEGWYQLGELAVEGYDFDRAGKVVEQLRKINPNHPLADRLEINVFLTQKDPGSARAVLERALARTPNHRELLALKAATEAVSYDPAALRAAMERFDQVSPGNPLAAMVTGKFLSMARQYQASEAMLRRAVALDPNWPEPRIELGLLLMQSGDEEHAKVELEQATKLDPFNRRAKNQLKLVQDLLGFSQIRTEHFIIKYKPGIDAALARDMPDVLEKIYRDITTIYGHRPAHTTLIEVLPDDQWFGVRITGTPDIWTIAASTGDVIGLTPPRQGVKQRGTFDWARVIRHEFVHTVTLDQTANRIPHWFTEACAVSQESGGRDYNTCQLLAQALRSDGLFTLDQINWAFIRPRTPRDRPLAYAQSHWMVQYITATYGHNAILQLLSLFHDGVGNEQAITQVTGKLPGDFLAEFKAWAGAEVKRWGLEARPADAKLAKLLAAEDPPAAADVAALLAQYPEQPDLLRLAAEAALRGTDLEAARQAVLRYAAARPVDPWSDQMLVALASRTHRPEEAVASLEQLDSQEQETGAWAHQLAEVYRARGQLEQAALAADRALQREPYNGTYRELAAAIALQGNNMDAAQRHLEAMTVIEPDKAVHFVRLAALYSKLGKNDEAKTTAEQAKKLDPKAAVEKFLSADAP